MSELPEITEVQRLTLKPGDRIIVHVQGHVNAQMAHLVKERVRTELRLSADVGVLVLDEGMNLITIDGILSAGDVDQIREIARAAMANPGKVARLGADGEVVVTDVGDL